MKRRSLYFTAPGQVEVREEPLPAPSAGEVLVRTLFSAISPGTELLIYRGQAPTELPVDETLPALSGHFGFPLKYGYSAVGQVVEVGPQVSRQWEGKQVFAFHPHESHFVVQPSGLFPLPPETSLEDATFLSNMETAVNFLMDGQPLVGEHVAVWGQGVVGLLTTALLAQFPLASLVTLDLYPLRREKSLLLGAKLSLDPQASSTQDLWASLFQGSGADLTFELSGNPQALDQALALTGFHGRVILGSWYGQKRASLYLGGRFHRSRIRLISSQVSTLSPFWSGRWTKARRLQVAWEMLRRVRPSRLITHRFPLPQAKQAYTLLDHHPEEALGVLFTYEE